MKLKKMLKQFDTMGAHDINVGIYVNYGDDFEDFDDDSPEWEGKLDMIPWSYAEMDIDTKEGGMDYRDKMIRVGNTDEWKPGFIIHLKEED